MMQVFDVFIDGILAGKIGKPPRRPVVFQLVEEYRHLIPRPVLGQQFEDHPRAKYWGVAEDLPAFFANLIPEEGPLRRIIEHSLGLTSRDDLALLVALGEGLPGAVEVRAGSGGAHLLDATQPPVTEATTEPEGKDNTVFRFSLGGVQMKFSVLLEADKLRLPLRDELGDWIVKFDSVASPNLPANEYAIMHWARETGFEVPECRLLSGTALPEALRTRVALYDEVFLIRRYDRINHRRIHQEDFAQVAGFRPALKYEHWSYETCARVVREVCGNTQYEEFIRRLVFMVASGNTDAHLKNWSFLYPDGINAVLTPMYDQVAVVAWQPPEPRMQMEWALNFAGSKRLDKIDEDAFRRLARLSGGNPDYVVQLVRTTLSSLKTSWQSERIAELLPPGHAEAIQQFWVQIPLLKSMVS
jgi:serine/threonine-protein kinase HipA